MTEKKPAIQVLERAGLLMDAIASQEEEAVSLKILSAETGLHPSTALRILSSLADIGFVRRTDSGRYSLGVKLRQLGCQVRVNADLRVEAKAIMEWLRDEVGETVNLTVREGDEVIYVDRSTVSRMMKVEQVIGSRAPLHVTAVGKLMLGEDGDVETEEYATRTGLPEYTSNTLTSLASLKANIAEGMQLGFARDDEEAELGVGCLGVLIHDMKGKPVAGLSISAPMERRRDEWIPLLMKAGKRLSERLGYIEA